jgi:hypothetical protein
MIQEKEPTKDEDTFAMDDSAVILRWRKTLQRFFGKAQKVVSGPIPEQKTNSHKTSFGAYLP